MKTLSKHCPSTIQATSKRVHFASKLCHAHVLLYCVFHKIDVSRLRPSTPYIILIRGTYWKNAPRLAGEGAARGRGGGWPLEFYHGVFWCPWWRWLSRPSRILPRRFLVPLVAVALKTFRTARSREWRCFGRCCTTAFWQSCTTT